MVEPAPHYRILILKHGGGSGGVELKVMIVACDAHVINAICFKFHMGTRISVTVYITCTEVVVGFHAIMATPPALV